MRTRPPTGICCDVRFSSLWLLERGSVPAGESAPAISYLRLVTPGICRPIPRASSGQSTNDERVVDTRLPSPVQAQPAPPARPRGYSSSPALIRPSLGPAAATKPWLSRHDMAHPLNAIVLDFATGKPEPESCQCCGICELTAKRMRCDLDGSSTGEPIRCVGCPIIRQCCCWRTGQNQVGGPPQSPHSLSLPLPPSARLAHSALL